MGQKRITVIGEVLPEEEKSPKEMKPEVAEEAPKTEETQEEVKEEVKKEEPKKQPGKARVRGKAYQGAKTKIEPGKTYALTEAVKLLKETSFAKFGGSAEVHFVVNKKGLSGEVALPHFEVKSKKVEVATEETLAKLEAGKIDFEVLVATPAFMPKLVKYAKVLGPKGLMPNPKSGTITEKPEDAFKKFEKAGFSYKTESSAPIIHAVFGKVSQKDEELEANLIALIKAINAKNIIAGVIKATMGPAIKIDLG